MSNSYYSDDESVDVHVRRYARAPSPRHYIQTIDRPHVRARSGYESGAILLNPERTVVTTRSRSRERRSSPPHQVAPVIIHNKIINDNSSDDDYSSGSSRHGRRRHRAHSKHSRRSSSGHLEYELERARRELQSMQLMRDSEADKRRLDRQYRGDAELRSAKQELDEIKRRERLEQEEKRLRKEIELKQLEAEKHAAEEKKKREKAAELAVAKYKADEAARIEKEKVEKDRNEKEYQRRLQEDLIKAGVDEKDIAAIIEKKKIKGEGKDRPTYTRMSLKHLDVTTLVYYKIEFEYDPEPGYVLIKRWVPEWEQDMLWEHSRRSRKHDHKVVLKIEDKKHHHKHKDDDQYMWVSKKHERKRSKSPGLLMYLAGGKPA